MSEPSNEPRRWQFEQMILGEDSDAVSRVDEYAPLDNRPEWVEETPDPTYL